MDFLELKFSTRQKEVVLEIVDDDTINFDGEILKLVQESKNSIAFRNFVGMLNCFSLTIIHNITETIYYRNNSECYFTNIVKEGKKLGYGVIRPNSGKHGCSFPKAMGCRYDLQTSVVVSKRLITPFQHLPVLTGDYFPENAIPIIEEVRKTLHSMFLSEECIEYFKEKKIKVNKNLIDIGTKKIPCVSLNERSNDFVFATKKGEKIFKEMRHDIFSNLI